MGKKGSPKMRVVDYYMSLHYGICHGPIDGLFAVHVKEKEAWPAKTAHEDESNFLDSDTISFGSFLSQLLGGQTDESKSAPIRVSSGRFSINRRSLFGGIKKQGGVAGKVAFSIGGPNEEVDPALPRSQGIEPDESPAYRGIANLFFFTNPKKGFLWGSNNPTVPPVWATVFRRPRGLTQNLATIQRGDNPPDANPSHIIFECLTNTVWGMGGSTSGINVQSFERCAQIFFDEKFGLSMAWMKEETIENFVSEVLDHVQALLFLNPRDGLLTLDVVRDDYDPDTLPVFGPDDCTIRNGQRKAWSETVNELKVSWTNPKNEKQESITFQDLANIAMQGDIVSDTRDYYGIRNAELASEVGARDIRSAGYPLYKCEMEIDREGWDLLPGKVLKLNWPEDGIEQVVMRIQGVDYGKPGSGKIVASLSEDIFALEQAQWTTPPTSGWIDPASDPLPLEYTSFFTTPYPLLSRAGYDENITEESYPAVVPAILAAPNTADFTNFELYGPRGADEFAPLGGKFFTSYSETAQVLPQEAVTEIGRDALGVLIGPYEPAANDVLVIGGGDLEMEIAFIESISDTTIRLRRAIWDTLPKAWPQKTPIWYLPSTFESVDYTERLAGADLEYKLLSLTSKGQLPLDAAPIERVSLTERPHLPFRPTALAIDGDDGFDIVRYLEAPEFIELSWNTRNRLTEDVVPRAWHDTSVTPEPGQTTVVVLRNAAGAVLAEYPDITGDTFDLPYADTNGLGSVTVEAVAERDGMRSQQSPTRTIEFGLSGYGNNYGRDYGQNDG